MSWIEWTGGVCPVFAGQWGYLEYRDSRLSPLRRLPVNAMVWRHSTDDPENDIVAYRVEFTEN